VEEQEQEEQEEQEEQINVCSGLKNPPWNLRYINISNVLF
jgi:hypothetical protein